MRFISKAYNLLEILFINMRISNLKIQNYRNFENFEIKLKPFTAIIGENNTGKSNLLNSLGLIFSQELSYFKSRNLELDDFNYNIIQEFKKNIANTSIPKENILFPEVKIDVELIDFDEDQEATIADWFVDEDLKKAQLTYLFSCKSTFNKLDWIENVRLRLNDEKQKEEETFEQFIERKSKYIDFPIQKYDFLIFGGNDQTKRADFHHLRMLKMEILDALRDSKKELTASKDYRLLYKILNNRGDACYSEIKKSLENLSELIRSNNELKLVKTEIKKYLDKISLNQSDIENIIELELSPLEHTELMKKISLRYGVNPITIERNGLGRNNLLYISLFLSHATKSNPDDETFFRIFGIEEPEAHLHPHLQINLAKNIQDIVDSNKVQIILTSHSSHLINKIKLENTSVIFREEGICKSHYLLDGFDLDIAENKKSVKYLQKYLDSTNSQMFFARKIILVEGISEQLLIPRFYEILKNKIIEKIGANIINVNGVAFKNFLNIIKNGYFIKAVVFTDNDAGTQTENRASNLQSNFESASIKIKISNQTTFEKDIIKANKSGTGKTKLIDALKLTRPLKGQKIETEIGKNDIDTNAFFEIIENYKSEFALNLLDVLDDPQGFIIPDYISEGLTFIDE